MAKYNKFWIALVGAVLVAIDQFFGISLSFDAERVMAILIPLLTAAGVWKVDNKA